MESKNLRRAMAPHFHHLCLTPTPITSIGYAYWRFDWSSVLYRRGCLLVHRYVASEYKLYFYAAGSLRKWLNSFHHRKGWVISCWIKMHRHLLWKHCATFCVPMSQLIVKGSSMLNYQNSTTEHLFIWLLKKAKHLFCKSFSSMGVSYINIRSTHKNHISPPMTSVYSSLH